MMAVRAKFTSKLSTTWLERTTRNLNLAGLEMATDIHRQASILAPRESGNLVASGRIDKNGDTYTVSFGGEAGGFSVPYAKRRHFENNKNPQTLRYLERAGDNVAKQKKKYIRKNK